MASSSQAEGSGQATSITNALNEITNSNDIDTLSSYLSNLGGRKEVRETVLSSLLEGGQDPLAALDPQVHTLAYLYILSARFTLPNAPLPPLEAVQSFCSNFNAIHARMAPERMTMLAKGIVNALEGSGNLVQSLPLLSELVHRYPPSLHHLTTIHPLFARACAATRQYTAALPVIEVPIEEIDTSLSDLHYNDNLVYHYSAGMIFTALRRWADAENCFDIVAGSPASTPAAIQLEALKKLALIQLILYGRLKKLPKYMSQTLTSLFMKSPYGSFVNDFPTQTKKMETLLEKEARFFESDKNLGLIQIAFGCAKRWSLKKLTETYVSLSLSEIGSAVGLSDPAEVRQLVLDMIQSKEVCGTISSDDTVSFHDPPSDLSRARIDALLATAQQRSAILVDLDKKMGRSREFLSKTYKNKDKEEWSHAGDEDMFRSDGRQGEWMDE